jgi:Bacterial surface proteins containing Ig-like domains
MFVMKRKNIVQKVLACAVTLAVAVMFMPCTVSAAAVAQPGNAALKADITAPASVSIRPSGARGFIIKWSSVRHADGYILQVKLGGKWYNKYKFPADVYGAKIEGTCHNETHIYRIQAFRGSVKKSSFWVSARTSLSHRKNVSTVTISKTSLTMTAGQSEKLSASLTPSSNIVSTYKRWKSSNRKVAAVSSNGTVTAKAAGTAKIWCIAHNGKKSEKCKVTVTEPAP